MSGNTTLITTLHLEGTSKGVLSVSNIEAPYGEGTPSVCSIGVSLTGEEDNPDWKVHIPYSQIDDVCAALQKAKEQHA